jgi:predicted  nucleic acid-binding Zn-ribbon protein
VGSQPDADDETTRDREDVVSDMNDLLEDVRTDLTDGADLALAAQLIGDALQRRIRRINRSLRHLESRADELDGDDRALRERIGTMRERTRRFETEMTALARRLDADASSFEDDLNDLADGLDGLLD